MRLLNRYFSPTTAWPLLVRELRAESRRPINYGLRVLTAAVMICDFAASVAAGTNVGRSQLGARLFDDLLLALMLAIWIIVPMMTADCISREKREGTLGLLFLTPLTVLGVIMGKAATHILRAATLVLVSAPLLLLPLVIGGVSWDYALMGIAELLNALLIGIAAGLYASAQGGSSIHVMVMAEVYASVFVVIFILFVNIFFNPLKPLLMSLVGNPLGELGVKLGIIVGYALVVFVLVMWASARVLRRSWHQDSAAPERPKWVKLFSGSYFWRSVFYWKHSRTLDRNPVAWLQEYSWTARLTKWGWFIAVLVAELFMWTAFPGSQPALTTAISLGIAFSATNSFRRERQSGLLEILLVTPVSARQLLLGRLWGLFCHFVPALAVLIVCWNGDRLMYYKEFLANPFALVMPNPVAFLALMVVGVYLSLWRLNFLVAWLLAWGVAFLLPTLVVIWATRFEIMRPVTIIVLTSIFQIALAVVCWFLLRRNIEERRFVSAEAV